MASPPPKASIVVVSFNAAALLRRCLASLVDQADACTAETIVVRAHRSNDPCELLQREFPQCRWITAPAGETIPRMRSTGMLAAHAPIVALLEDDCVIAPTWCGALLEVHRGPWVAVGGAVEPGPYQRGVDWAVYFYEYGRFMLPFDAHQTAVLPGNNVSYKREALSEWVHENDEGFYDFLVHSAWRARGQLTLITPTLVIQNWNSWRLSYVLIAPFHHGRGFAAKRMHDQPLHKRLALACLALLLPLVQVYRSTRLTFARGRLFDRLVLGLPAFVLFGASWAMGECVGYLLGAGRSARRWR